jgi:hypothetical protein
MRFLVPLMTVAALAGCSDPTEQTAAPSAGMTAVTAPVADARSSAVEMSVEQMCREAARRLYGQDGAAVSFDASNFSISWPAPVDGGRLAFACSHVGNQVSLTRDGERQTVDVLTSATGPTPQGAQ